MILARGQELNKHEVVFDKQKDPLPHTIIGAIKVTIIIQALDITKA